MCSLTVLLVDDDGAVRACLRDALEVAGLAVLEAADAKAALAIATTAPQPIEILLTDVLMPGIDGTELARRVQRLRPETGVLYMSGCSEAELAARGLLVDETAFLAKPFGPNVLLDRLRNVARGFSPAGIRDRAPDTRGTSVVTQVDGVLSREHGAGRRTDAKGR
jgi:two-component system cell cycle sensor histidine kinase/response regulator CckA